jgi:predicted metal-binding membrane protein
MASIPRSLISPSQAALPEASRLAAAGIAVVLGLSWAYLLYMGWGMEHMDKVAGSVLMPAMVGWGGADLMLVFVMWAIMMAAMMLPSAAPMLMLFAKVSAVRSEGARGNLAVGVFALGYLATWAGFSALATLAQWGLLEARLVSPMMSSASPAFSAALLAAAGAYQFSPLKNACLARCRSPLSFLLNEWRDGLAGAFSMGLRQGAYCTACCGVLMALLFVFGVMNLLWIAALTIFVLVEKLLGGSRWFAAVTGAMLLAWAAGVAYQAANLPA